MNELPSMDKFGSGKEDIIKIFGELGLTKNRWIYMG